MSELFGDARHDRKRKKEPILPKCGSCDRRVQTTALPVSGLRRCRECVERMGLRPPADRTVAPQPELDGVRVAPTSQPTVTRGTRSGLVEDFKHRQAGDEVA